MSKNNFCQVTNWKNNPRTGYYVSGLITSGVSIKLYSNVCYIKLKKTTDRKTFLRIVTLWNNPICCREYILIVLNIIIDSSICLKVT